MKKTHKCPKCPMVFPSNSKLITHLVSTIPCTERPNTENCIRQSKNKYGDRFSYVEFDYTHSQNKVVLICIEHNHDFPILFYNHMTGNGGCKHCSGVYHRSFEELKIECHLVHGNLNVYDEITEQSYTTYDSKLKIKCIKCDVHYEQPIKTHLAGGKCPTCFIENLYKIHQVKLSTLDNNCKIFIHPVYPKYSYDAESDKILGSRGALKLTPNIRGSIPVTVSLDKESRKKTYFHLFKYECMYQEIIPEGFEIDHRDGNPRNNAIENLQCLSKKDHGTKTAIDNPDRGAKVGKTQGLSGVAKNSATGNQVIFDSINDLSRKIETSPANIHRFLKKGESPPRGYDEITFDTNYIENETWKIHPIHDLEVSDFGRVKDGKRETYGSLDGHLEYRMFSGKRVHILVLETFISMRPSPSHTGDHINNNTQDNRVTNLRWATPSEQSLNQRHKKSRNIQQIDAVTYEILNEFPDIATAKKELGIDHIQMYNPSHCRPWFIIMHDGDLNIMRKRHIASVMKYGKCVGDRIKGLISIKNVLQSDQWAYNQKYSVFYTGENKRFNTSMSKKKKNSQDIMETLAKEHNAAKIIQIGLRSYNNYRRVRPLKV